LETVSRGVLLAYHDILVLLSLGLLGSLGTDFARASQVRVFCVVGLSGLAAAAISYRLAPAPWRTRLRNSRLGAWINSWSLSRSLQLAGLRLCYFGILVVYAAIALLVTQIPVNAIVVLSTIPLVLLADGLPSVSGLGVRETALVTLLSPENPARLTALSLLWSNGMVVARLAIGLLHYWALRRTKLLPGNGRSGGPAGEF